MPGVRSTTPILCKGKFRWTDTFIGGTADYECVISSPAWLAWLEGENHSTFYYDNVVCDFTARREKRRNKWIWYAFKSANGRTYKAYIGPSHLVNQERLDQAADKLYQKI